MAATERYPGPQDASAVRSSLFENSLTTRPPCGLRTRWMFMPQILLPSAPSGSMPTAGAEPMSSGEEAEQLT